MFFYMPVKVFQESECVFNHRKEIAALGTKALIVTGYNSSKINGSLQDVENALKKENIKYAVFDEIEENPSVDSIVKAREFGLRECADFVIGIGGGSPLDSAKAIALMMKNPTRDESLLYEKKIYEHLPIVAVPTTCGTGSEVTPYSILTNHKTKTKASISHKIFPAYALIDAKYLMHASQKIIANTAIDALGHLLESYVNTNATSYSRMLCNYGLSVWRENKDVITGQEELTLERCERLLLVSTIAGMAITHTSTSLPHGMSYKLTYEMGVPHGKGIGLFQASYLRHADAETRLQILHQIGMRDCDELQQFIQNIIGTITITEDTLQEAVAEMMGNERKLAACPYPVDKKLMEQFYRESLLVEE